MGFITKCLSVFVVLTVVIVGLFDMVMYPAISFSGNFLTGSFTAIILTIFYGWIYDMMFYHSEQPGLEE